MPLEHDPFSPIINVQWGAGGGVFIAGDIDSNIYYLKVNADEKKPAWQTLGKLDFQKEDDGGFVAGRVAGSAFAMVESSTADGSETNPVFVLVGGSGFANEFGIIMASRDGLDWSKVFSFGEREDSETYVGAGIFGVVWKEAEQKFYAGGHQLETGVDAEAGFRWEEQIDLLFQSSDGYTWSESSRHVTRVEAPLGQPFNYPAYNSGLLVPHCSTRVQDKNGNGIPDGNYGYDDDDNILVVPTEVIAIDYLFGLYLNDIPQNCLTVTVTGEPSYPSDVGIPITCTATAGGRWLAAGGVLGNFDAGEGRTQAAILVSSESGYVWRELNPTDGMNMIITMTGGRLETETDAGL